MSKGKRGIGLNRPCIKCGAEVPSLFVSPVQEGLCGKCTDEALKVRKKDENQKVREVTLIKAPVLRMILLVAAGAALGFAIAVLLASVAPSAWESLVSPIRGIFK